jgi:TM2 domain-containing membrane protein YozV
MLALLESKPMATTQPIAQPVPGEKRSSLPALALLLGWLIPGAGHLLLGKWIRGLLLFVSIVSMFLIGIGLQGKIYAPNTGDILDMLGFAGQIGMGALYAIARIGSLGASTVVNALGDYGTKFLIVAGLLNIIAAVDAHSLANGRKALY